MRRLNRIVAAVLAATVGLSACGSDPKPKHAAEPANAPALTATPAGTIARVGAKPEGIAYDPTTKTLAVAVRAPARLLLLDPSTLRVRKAVPLPGTVRHLQATGTGAVLVPVESAGDLVEVALPAGTTRTTKVGKQPHDAAAAAGGEIVVGNEFGRSLSFVSDGRVLQTVSGPRQPGGIIGAGARVGVIDVHNYTLSTYDVSSRKRRAIVDAGKGPTHGVLIGRNRIAVTDTRGNAVLVFTIDPLKEVGSLALAGAPYGIAVDGDSVWITLTARNQLVGLDVSGNTPEVIARYPTVRQPNTVAVAPGGHRIWVTGTSAGVVQAIDR